MHNPVPPSVDQLKSLLKRAQETGMSNRVCQRLQWFLYFALHGNSVSETCSHFGIARSTFHRWRDRFDPNDLASLEELSHEPVSVRQSAVPQETVELIRRYRMRWPQIGKERLQRVLAQEHQVNLSVSAVGRIIDRECLYFGDTPLHWRKRMRKHGEALGTEALSTKREMLNTDAVQESGSADVVITERPVDVAVASDTSSHVRVVAEGQPACTCMFCRFHDHGWEILKRSLLVASLVINTALIGLMLATATWEKSKADERHAAAPPAVATAGAAGEAPASYSDTDINLD